MYTVLQNEKWCKTTEVQQNKQTEPLSVRGMRQRMEGEDAQSSLYAHSQLLSSQPVCWAHPGQQRQLVWLSPFWEYFCLEGTPWPEPSRAWGDMRSACSPFPSLGGAAWPRNPNSFAAFPLHFPQGTTVKTWREMRAVPLIKWLLRAVVANSFFFLLPQY